MKTIIYGTPIKTIEKIRKILPIGAANIYISFYFCQDVKLEELSKDFNLKISTIKFYINKLIKHKFLINN